MVSAKYRKKTMPRQNSRQNSGLIKGTSQMRAKSIEAMARYRGSDRLQEIAKKVKENEKNRRD